MRNYWLVLFGILSLVVSVDSRGALPVGVPSSPTGAYTNSCGPMYSKYTGTINPNPNVTNIPSIIDLGSYAVGETIAAATTVLGVADVDCSNYPYANVHTRFSMKLGDGSVNASSVPNVVKLLNDSGQDIGIGIRAWHSYVTNSGLSQANSVNPAYTFPIEETSAATCLRCKFYIDAIYVEFVKTAPFSAGGVIKNGTMLVTSGGVYGYTGQIRLGKDVTVKATACGFLEASRVRTLPSVSAGNLTAIGHEGPLESPSLDFSLNLQCNQVVPLTVTLDGTSPAGVSQSGVLQPEASSTAAGVGVQLLNKGQPITLGTPIVDRVPSIIGDNVLNMKARYYKLPGAVTPGEIQTIATITVLQQ